MKLINLLRSQLLPCLGYSGMINHLGQNVTQKDIIV